MLVDILLELFLGECEDYITHKGKQKVLCTQMLIALHGMLVSSILNYKKFCKDIETIGFEVNPRDIFTANRNMNSSQQTMSWHVDDIKSSHIDPKINDEFAVWCEKQHGSDLNGYVKVVHGKKHNYLTMIIDYAKSGALKVDMRYCTKNVTQEFPFPIKTEKVAP